MIGNSTLMSLPSKIDHTALAPNLCEVDIVKVCTEAREFGFKAVCIDKQWLAVAVKELKGSPVFPISVVSFPNGQDTREAKIRETRDAIEQGAKEIDVVMNRCYLKEKDYKSLYGELSGVVQAADGTPIKVILETSELNYDEKIIACSLAQAAGAAFVKTSTGFSSSGATENDILLLRNTVGKEVSVKASGGIRTLADAARMIAAGADRLGCSSSVRILKELEHFA